MDANEIPAFSRWCICIFGSSLRKGKMVIISLFKSKINLDTTYLLRWLNRSIVIHSLLFYEKLFFLHNFSIIHFYVVKIERTFQKFFLDPGIECPNKYLPLHRSISSNIKKLCLAQYNVLEVTIAKTL